MTPYLLLALGLVVLVGAGDLLVRGSVALAVRLGIPTLVIGLTIVAFGTSAPELVVSVGAALAGSPDIALGNIVGSNIFNVLFVLGLPSILRATRCDEPGLMRNTAFMLFATAVFIALAFTSPLHRWQGAVLVLLMAGFLWDMAARLRHPATAPGPPDAAPDTRPDAAVQALAPPVTSLLLAVLLIVVGLAGLPLGAHLAVAGAREIALALGMSEAAVGLTIVAAGTSLPELAATTMAALRRENAIAVGNVIGSNIFNLLTIMGLTTLLAPVPVAPQMLRLDLWVMLAAALAVAPFVYWRWRIGRIAGLAFVAAYVLYVSVVLAQQSGA